MLQELQGHLFLEGSYSFTKCQQWACNWCIQKIVHKVFVLLEYEAVGQNSRDMCFFNYKSCTGVSFLTGALFEQEKTIKHFTDKAATRDRQPVPYKTTELYKLSQLKGQLTRKFENS